MRKYNRNVMAVLRAVLFLAGAVLGFFAMRQITLAYPKAEFEKYGYVYCAATGVVLGLVLMLSAGSVMWLASSLIDGVKSLLRGAKPSNIVCVLVCITLGVVLTWLFDFLVSFGLELVELRIILDVVFAFVSVSLLSVAALKILPVQKAEARAEKCDSDEFKNGYVLTASALCCDGIDAFIEEWLLTPVTVLDCTVGELIGRGNAGEKALAAYRRLLNGGKTVTVSAAGKAELAATGKVSERDAVLSYARENSFRIVAATACEFGADARVPVLGFLRLTGFEAFSDEVSSSDIECAAPETAPNAGESSDLQSLG